VIANAVMLARAALASAGAKYSVAARNRSGGGEGYMRVQA
jgi:hypothetical protein